MQPSEIRWSVWSDKNPVRSGRVHWNPNQVHLVWLAGILQSLSVFFSNIFWVIRAIASSASSAKVRRLPFFSHLFPTHLPPSIYLVPSLSWFFLSIFFPGRRFSFLTGRPTSVAAIVSEKKRLGLELDAIKLMWLFGCVYCFGIFIDFFWGGGIFISEIKSKFRSSSFITLSPLLVWLLNDALS